MLKSTKEIIDRISKIEATLDGTAKKKAELYDRQTKELGNMAFGVSSIIPVLNDNFCHDVRINLLVRPMTVRILHDGSVEMDPMLSALLYLDLIDVDGAIAIGQAIDKASEEARK